MNNISQDLITRCLHGGASLKEWRLLESAIATDPVSASRWLQAVRLHESLRSLHGTGWAWVNVRNWRGAVAVAAGLAAVFVLAMLAFSWRQVQAPTTHHTAAAQEAGPVEPTAPVSAEPRPLTLIRVPVTDKIMALTFEDGPSLLNTPRLLDMLRKAGAKATFFPVGSNIVKAPEVLRRIHAEGHDIGNHTWTHPKLSTMPDDKVREEIGRTQEAIIKITGTTPRFWRPPYGAVTAAQKQMIMDEFGMTTVLWSVDSLDWRIRDVALIPERVRQEARPGGIVLFHDIHATTVEAVPAVLEGLKADGYRFVTLTELAALWKPEEPLPAKGSQLEPGKK